MPPSVSQGILLVDGYNIIGAWAELKLVRDRDGLAAARRELVEQLVGYSAYQGFTTEVVFDAQYQETASSRETVNKQFRICYTDYRQTADTYIEITCAKFRNDLRKFDHRLIVATSDRAQQLTVVGYGAEWMSAQQLWAEVGAATHRVRTKQQNKQRSHHRFLSSSLDPAAKERLARMRLGLDRDQP